MSPRTKRQAQAAERREQLLKTAFLLFSERGYRATSIRDIAKASGVTEGLLYHYFTGKADLFSAVLTEYTPFKTLDPLFEAAGDRPVGEALRAIGYAFLSLVSERRAFALTMLTEAPGDPELGALLGTFLQSIRARLAAFLAYHQATRHLDPSIDVEAAAQAFLGSLFLHFLSTSVFSQPDPSQSANNYIVDLLVQTLLSGLAPRGQL
jgi:AcrR family transcriptional regulator